jgi:predicted transcriptional regulator
MPTAGWKRKPTTAQTSRTLMVAEAWLANGLNQHATARALGITQATVSRHLRRPEAQDIIEHVLAEQYNQALGPDVLFARLKEKLTAKKTIPIGEQVVEVDDHATQMEVLKLALDIPFRVARLLVKMTNAPV